MRSTAEQIKSDPVCAPEIDGALIFVNEMTKNGNAVIFTHDTVYIIPDGKIPRLQLKTPIAKWHKAAHHLNTQAYRHNPKHEPRSYSCAAPASNSAMKDIRSMPETQPYVGTGKDASSQVRIPLKMTQYVYLSP